MPRRLAKIAAPLALVAFATLTLSCASTQEGVRENPKAVLGSVTGAGVGGAIAAVAGASPWAIAFSALAGGLLGGYIGRQLDERDKRMAVAAAQEAFENNKTGMASTWNNPDTGNSGSITPTRTYQLGDGQYCRRYEQTIMIGGEPHQTFGTACRQEDGTWQIQS